MTPDIAARKLLVAAYLYYALDANPVMTDSEYDVLSDYVASNWNELDPMRQWQLGDPESARSSGSHFLFTALTIGAARTAYLNRYGRAAPGDWPEKWKQREDGLRYVTTLN